jgi:hypothetical protein
MNLFAKVSTGHWTKHRFLHKRPIDTDESYMQTVSVSAGNKNGLLTDGFHKLLGEGRSMQSKGHVA